MEEVAFVLDLKETLGNWIANDRQRKQHERNGGGARSSIYGGCRMTQ